MAKMGRPRKEIDKTNFEKLCGMQCTLEEICDFFDVQDKTLNSWCKRTYNKTFYEVFKQKRSIGKISLRRSGFKLAETNPSVHIFYAKNFLGMSDEVKQTVSVISDETRSAVDELVTKARAELDKGRSNCNSDSCAE